VVSVLVVASSGTPPTVPRVAPGGRSAGRRRYGDAIATVALLSFRLGGSDGVAIEAAKWQRGPGGARLRHLHGGR